MTPFRDRSPVKTGIAGLTTLALLTAAAFNIDDLPLIGNGDHYSASFSEAGGLKAGDEVRIAGVKVGKVDEVALDDDHVRVSFRLRGDPALGTRTGAAIRVKTILGAKYLALEPDGRGQLPEGSTIPRSRTTPAYDVVEAFSDLTTTTEKVDKKRLAKSMDTLSATFKDSPEEVRASVKGLSKLSRTVSSRDEKLRELLRHAKGVSGVLAKRSGDFTELVEDGDKLFKEINARRKVIHSLLKNAVRMSVQLSGLVKDNREQIGPALSRLNTVVRMLERNQKSLDRSAALLGPYSRVFANTLGNGPWFDSYVHNLVAVPGKPRGGPDVKPGGSR
ncbi:MCE family protein [Streptomyces sp. WMMB 322]|uniref:MCE family protein n=1 Tax=Streptomyces sp. WMMB 322 TaxID=1286821 RepID=UPI0006E216D9|nr:MCE family protein [Streptomyces sp. WMMB 322]SCK27854.1 phospholipid/cholesterol/gamma-HCH transport system substrate-binding protein [Streptomyces sp. WMMB 322]